MPDRITSEEIIKINKELGYSPLNSHLVDSALSSIHYYPDVKHRIASIIRGLIKNHAFRDGNKRTAMIVYVYLSERNKLKPKAVGVISHVMIDIAANNYSVETVKSKLF